MANDFSLNTIRGPNSRVSGDVDAAGFTRVDGSLRGNLNAKGRVIIGEKARMKSDVSGTSVTIGGVVCGNVIASERLVILASGLVLGDIITRRIQADEGCLIHGKVSVCTTDEQWEKTIAEYRDTRGVLSALSSLSKPVVSKAPKTVKESEKGKDTYGLYVLCALLLVCMEKNGKNRSKRPFFQSCRVFRFKT
jgi:cytoskeletal protein CcmA (bactofilin family)